MLKRVANEAKVLTAVMRIAFEFSGGYGGLFARRPLHWQADLEALPSELRARLLALIDESGILEPGGAAVFPTDERARDTFTYKVTITDEAVQRTLACDDANAPARLRPLLACLQEIALAERMPQR